MIPLKRKIYDTLTGIRFVDVTKDELSESLIEVINQIMYSEEEVLELLKRIQEQTAIDYNDDFMFAEEWFNKYKKK